MIHHGGIRIGPSLYNYQFVNGAKFKGTPAAAAAAGSTPLHFAVDVDRPESAQILLILVFRFGIAAFLRSGSGFMMNYASLMV